MNFSLEDLHKKAFKINSRTNQISVAPLMKNLRGGRHTVGL